MRRSIPFICLLAVILPLAAQMPPEWTNAASRMMHYPPESYYTGYVEGSQQSDETLEDAFARLKDAARVELVSTIRTSVEQTMDSRAQSDMLQSGSYFDEQVRESFVSETRITSSIKDIPGLKVEAFQNPQNGAIAAFAFVKRQSLINHLVKRIALLIGKAENNLQQAAELAGSGYKFKARAVIEKGLQYLAEAEEAQNLLAAVDETADEESLQTEQTRALARQLVALDHELQNAVAVFIQCEAQLFANSYTLLQGAIEGALSGDELSFVDDPEEADWAIYIRARAQEHAKTDFGSMSNYAALVEAHIDIDKKSNGKRVYSGSLTSNVANHTRGFDSAAKEAYKEITPQLIEILKKQINR